MNIRTDLLPAAELANRNESRLEVWKKKWAEYKEGTIDPKATEKPKSSSLDPYIAEY